MATERPLLEASLEGAEVVADIITSEAVWSEVPLIGTAIKICKASDSIRERIFAAKVLAFLRDLSSVPPHERETLIKALKAGGVEAERATECLIMTLERATDLEKPRVLAALFAANLHQKVNASLLRRLTQAVDQAFIDDLVVLLGAHEFKHEIDSHQLVPLVSSGLAEFYVDTGFGTAGKVSYRVSRLGNQLRTAYFEGRKILGLGRDV